MERYYRGTQCWFPLEDGAVLPWLYIMASSVDKVHALFKLGLLNIEQMDAL